MTENDEVDLPLAKFLRMCSPRSIYQFLSRRVYISGTAASCRTLLETLDCEKATFQLFGAAVGRLERWARTVRPITCKMSELGILEHWAQRVSSAKKVKAFSAARQIKSNLVTRDYKDPEVEVSWQIRVVVREPRVVPIPRVHFRSAHTSEVEPLAIYGPCPSPSHTGRAFLQLEADHGRLSVRKPGEEP